MLNGKGTQSRALPTTADTRTLLLHSHHLTHLHGGPCHLQQARHRARIHARVAAAQTRCQIRQRASHKGRLGETRVASSRHVTELRQEALPCICRASVVHLVAARVQHLRGIVSAKVYSKWFMRVLPPGRAEQKKPRAASGQTYQSWRVRVNAPWRCFIQFNSTLYLRSRSAPRNAVAPGGVFL